MRKRLAEEGNRTQKNRRWERSLTADSQELPRVDKQLPIAPSQVLVSSKSVVRWTSSCARRPGREITAQLMKTRKKTTEQFD